MFDDKSHGCFVDGRLLGDKVNEFLLSDTANVHRDVSLESSDLSRISLLDRMSLSDFSVELNKDYQVSNGCEKLDFVL